MVSVFLRYCLCCFVATVDLLIVIVVGLVTGVALPPSLVRLPLCMNPRTQRSLCGDMLVECERNLHRRNYLSGTYLESIRLKEAKSTVIVNNRVSTAATIS